MQYLDHTSGVRQSKESPLLLSPLPHLRWVNVFFFTPTSFVSLLMVNKVYSSKFKFPQSDIHLHVNPYIHIKTVKVLLLSRLRWFIQCPLPFQHNDSYSMGISKMLAQYCIPDITHILPFQLIYHYVLSWIFLSVKFRLQFLCYSSALFPKHFVLRILKHRI